MKMSGSFLIVCLLAFVPYILQANEKFRVIDRGLDGNQRIYLITCPDGNSASVIEEFLIREQEEKPVQENNLRMVVTSNVPPPELVRVCIYPYHGEESCRSSWPLDEAARASCQ